MAVWLRRANEIKEIMKEKLVLQATLIIMTMGAYLITILKHNISKSYEYKIM
jgi:hypothetical protein